jgi:hypothetical protein
VKLSAVRAAGITLAFSFGKAWLSGRLGEKLLERGVRQADRKPIGAVERPVQFFQRREGEAGADL